MELRNATEHRFTDISSEEWRTYEFYNWFVHIEEPLWLSVSESGGPYLRYERDMSLYPE